jgi:hypothetical protein
MTRQPPPSLTQSCHPILVDLVGCCFNCLRPDHVVVVYPQYDKVPPLPR